MSALSQAGLFLIQVIFGLYGAVLILRIMLRLAKADYYNPFVQGIVKATQRPVKIFKTIVPDIGGIETATLFVLFFITLVKLFLECFLSSRMPSISGLALWTLADMLGQIFQLFFYLVIFRAIMSWFNTSGNPVAAILYLVTEPLLSKARRVIPSFGAFDLSPIAILIVLQLLLIVLVNPLTEMGVGLAFS